MTSFNLLTGLTPISDLAAGRAMQLSLAKIEEVSHHAAIVPFSLFEMCYNIFLFETGSGGVAAFCRAAPRENNWE
jgi:hypothetical protein